jgi:hypothetical protein
MYLYYKGRNIWEQFSPNVKHTHPSQRTHMSGETHPKELDETWDSQIFRFSKMFPLKTKFFCYQARLFTHPCVPAPWFVALSLSALSFKCNLMSHAWIALSFRYGACLIKVHFPSAMELSYSLVWAFLFKLFHAASLSYLFARRSSRCRSPPHLPIAPRSVAAETRRPPP